VKELTYGGMFWKVSYPLQQEKEQKNAYLLCNIGSAIQDKLKILRSLGIRNKPVTDKS